MWDKEPLLAVRGMRKSFGRLEVLTGVDIDLQYGEVLGIVGPNGVGKSTMASIIAGYTSADEGVASLGGGAWDPRRIMLIDPQNELDPKLTVVEAMFRHVEGQHSLAELMTRAKRILSETGIPLSPTHRLGGLSHTERRMAEVVRMLADPRDVIVIDELSNALNSEELEDLRYALNRTVEEGRGVLYITHQLEEALRLCNRIAVLRDGKVEAIFDSATTTVEELTEAMFGSVVEITPRRANATADVVMDVAGLECTKEPVSFQLNRGEVLGFTGVRDSGVEEVRDALIGKRPAYMASLTVDGRAARITAPRDLPSLGIAVLTNMLDPESEAHAARNIVMLDGEDQVDDEAIEDTTRILLMLKESETRMSEILHRPVQSTGQRRWQQMQEIASQNARIMILIQPTDGLDIATRERFVRLLEEITGRGVGVLLCTSDERELHQFSDRVIVMSGGAIQEEWDTRSITADHLHAAARRGA